MLDRVAEKSGIDTAIGVAVRDLREARGFSARQLSSKSGVSAAMISRIESGQTSPSISTLTGISRALGVPLVSLFRDTGVTHTDFTHVKQFEGMSKMMKMVQTGKMGMGQIMNMFNKKGGGMPNINNL